MELPLWHVPHVKSILLQTWQRLKSFVFRAGKVIVVVCVVIAALNSFSFNGKPVSNINDSALASVSKALTPLLAPMGVHQDNWQATVGLVTGAMAKEVVVGTLNTLYTAESLQDNTFNAETFSLTDELKEAVDETWYGIKHSFSTDVLLNPIEASKGDGSMTSGAMGTMHTKFANDAAAYSYLIFVLLYIPCVSVMGAIARESSRRWMFFSIFWGLNLAWSLATLFYQLTRFTSQPGQSTMIITVIVLLNIIFCISLRLVRLPPEKIPVKLLTSGCNTCNRKKTCH
ncbi:MAG: Fe(2+) transporter FeoB [Candidatus Erwinia impunctatus]|nr:Fe(2+) transporter FeoB [Culicoides impunctatus]